MPKRTWTLTDVDQDVYVESLSVRPADLEGAPAGWSVTKRALRGGLREGVDVIEVDNGRLKFVVIPTRGMGLWNAALGSLRIGWNSPVKGPVHPAFVRLNEASGIGWLDGFDELLVRCGLESNGAPEFDDGGALRYPLHGKIANIPAHKVELCVDGGIAAHGDWGEIAVTGVVDEARLFGNKLRMTTTVTTRVGSAGLSISDTIRNLSAEPGELELLYHINFGVPLLNPGSKVVLPVKTMAPRDAAAVGNVSEWDTYAPEAPGSKEAVFFFDLAADDAGRTHALLHNAAADRGVSLEFDKTQLPCFSLWKNPQAAADGYVTGLEPGTNFPNRRSFEKRQGRVIVLEPGQSRTFELSMEIHGDAAGVAAAKQAVARLQAGTTPTILPGPNPEWTPP
jgi:galactose mutarotase-like enzyme